MTQSSPDDHSWLEQRVFYWREFAEELKQLEDRKPLPIAAIRDAVRRYPELARDVAMARREAPRSRVTAYLELIYTRLHRVLFTPPRSTWGDVRKLFLEEIPDIARDLRLGILCIALGFVLSVVAGWWLVETYPELAALFASESMIKSVEQGQLWTDGLLNIMPSSVLSAQIFTNNILVSLTAMCLGVFYGLGTLYIVGLNGLMLGSVFALTAEYGMDDELFKFILAHGMVELSVIFVAGAIGFSIGESLARPGQRTRIEAFQHAVHRGTKLMLLCIVFLIGAGLIEGYISPNPAYSITLRWAVGFSYWLLFLFALCGWRLRRPQVDTGQAVHAS